jgi:hypothetical protein
MLVVQNRMGMHLQWYYHYFYPFFHLLYQRKDYFHHEEGPQELGMHSQRLWGVGRRVGDVRAAFHIVG